MSGTTIRTDDNDLRRLLCIYISDENMRKLIYDIMSVNFVAVEWAFKFHLGHIYPTVPDKGAVGYINLETYQGWNGDVDKYKNSNYVQQGYLKVTVLEFRGLNHYHPLIVEAPAHEENKIEWNNQFQISCNEFISENDLDLDSLF